VMYRVMFTRQALKDIKKLKSAGLSPKGQKLSNVTVQWEIHGKPRGEPCAEISPGFPNVFSVDFLLNCNTLSTQISAKDCSRQTT
jgi:hypothetical protein